MTVRECYEELGSDFDKVLSRLVSEALVKVCGSRKRI